jgi:alpha-tubulin suppressor-like RCC1 family protein
LTTSSTGQTPVVNSATSTFKLSETGYGYGGVYQKDEQLYKYGSGNTIRFFGTSQGNGEPTVVPMIGRSSSANIEKFAYTMTNLVALDSDGKLYVHGYNHYGVHGDGNTTGSFFNHYLEPVTDSKIYGTGIVIEDFWLTKMAYNNADNSETSIIVRVNDNGTYKHYAWGHNVNDVLGVGVASDYILEPTQLANDATNFATDKIVKVDIISISSIVITESGKVYGAGYNRSGQLGIGNYTTPISAFTLSNITSGATDVKVGWIDGAGVYSQVLMSDGTVQASGHNGRYNLGNVAITERNTFAPIAGLAGITKIDTMMDVNIALNSSGDLYGWGYNYDSVWGSGDAVNAVAATPKIIQTSIADFWVLGTGVEGRGLVTVSTTGATKTSGTNSNYRFGAGNTLYFGDSQEYPVQVRQFGLGITYVGTGYLTNRGNLYFTGLADGNAVYSIPGLTYATVPFLMD